MGLFGSIAGVLTPSPAVQTPYDVEPQQSVLTRLYSFIYFLVSVVYCSAHSLIIAFLLQSFFNSHKQNVAIFETRCSYM